MSDISGDSPPRSGRTVSDVVRSLSKPLIGGLCALWLVVPQLKAAETAADEGTTALQEVVVTGSRIPVPGNITSTSPIAAVSAQDIELQGRTDTTDILNQLPQAFINAAVDLGNTSNPLSAPGGIATVDLRALGPQRTLVLVDGKRLGLGDPATTNPNPAPDIDQIPASMIERVDVVTGGASAVYGSDAMAGVVNFILKRNFQGVQVDGQYALYQHNNHESAIQAIDASTATATGNPNFNAPTGSVHDGYRRDFSVMMGTNVADGMGNFTAYLTYHNQDPVSEHTRDYSSCELVTADATDLTCIGSSNSNRFTVKGKRYSVVGNQFLPYPQVGSSPPSQFDPQVYQILQREDVRYNAGVLSHLDLNDYVKPYFDFSFMDDRTTTLVGPSAMFQTSFPYTPDNLYRVNCTNPFLSAQEQSILCTPAQITADAATPGLNPAGLATVDIGRRNVEGGGRVSFYEHINYRAVLGSTGTIVDGINYDLYAQYYYTSAFSAFTNYLNYTNAAQALLVTGTAAAPVCAKAVSTCVPWNIFNTGGVTAAQLAYLQTPGTTFGTNSEGIVHVDFTAELGKFGLTSPWAHDGMALNVGAEHRYEALTYDPDAVAASGALAGFSGAVTSINAGYTVNEGFGEFRVPVVQDLPFAKDLDVDAGYRYSSYKVDVASGGYTTNTYKFEVQYQPISDARLRYSYDRATRAPNLIELFNPPSYGQQSFVGVDPCAGATPTATLAQCENTHVTPAQYGNISQCIAAQCGQVIGGNTALTPEQADTYSLGITLTPSMLPNFTGSIDYYHIELFNEIGSYPGSYLFNQCLLNATPTFCNQIVRNSITGSLSGATVAGGGYILQTVNNLGTAVQSGIDVQLAYRQALGPAGTLVANLNGAYLEHAITTPAPGVPSYDCAGLFGVNCANTPNARWRHTLRLNWETPWAKLLISANWRFVSAVGFDNNSPNPFLNFAEEGGYDQINRRIPGYNYFDLSAVWPVWHDIQLRAGVNNVLDKDPPVLPIDIVGTGFGNSYPTYDLLGRDIFVAISAKF